MPLPSDNPNPEAASADAGTSTDNSESAEGNQNTEVSENEETSSEDSSEDSAESTSSNQRLLAGKFKTQEALEESYQNLQRAFSRTANENHRLRTTAQQSPQNTEADIVKFADDLKRNPIEAIRNITKADVEQAREDAKQVRFESTYQHLKATNKEFAELDPTMSQLAVKWEEMILANHLQNDPRLLDVLFLAARGLKQQQLADSAEERGRQKGELTAIKKTKAQVEGSSGSKGHVNKNFEELSLEDMEKELKKQLKTAS